MLLLHRNKDYVIGIHMMKQFLNTCNYVLRNQKLNKQSFVWVSWMSKIIDAQIRKFLQMIQMQN